MSEETLRAVQIAPRAAHRTVIFMPRDFPSTYKFTVTSGDSTVSLRDAVSAVWKGQASPDDFEVELTPYVPQSHRNLNRQEVEDSDQSPQSLASHRPTTSEV